MGHCNSPRSRWPAKGFLSFAAVTEAVGNPKIHRWANIGPFEFYGTGTPSTFQDVIPDYTPTCPNSGHLKLLNSSFHLDSAPDSVVMATSHDISKLPRLLRFQKYLSSHQVSYGAAMKISKRNNRWHNSTGR